jgi:hypothetical protein
VERLFGTLQDRLVVELRLVGACTLEQANGVVQTYLPRFNAQFAVPPAQVGTAYRPFPAGLAAEEVFCFKYGRTVALDNTVQLGEHRRPLLPDKERRSYARAHVEVHERLDGSLAVYYAGRCLASTSAPLEAPVLRARAGRLTALPQPARSVAAGSTSEDSKGQDAAPTEAPAAASARGGSVPRSDHRLLQEIAAASGGSVGGLVH